MAMEVVTAGAADLRPIGRHQLSKSPTTGLLFFLPLPSIRTGTNLVA